MKSLLLCNCLVFYTARLFYILLHATILGVTLKGLVSVYSQLSSFLRGKAGLRKEDACIVTKNDKYLNSISVLTF